MANGPLRLSLGGDTVPRMTSKSKQAPVPKLDMRKQYKHLYTPSIKEVEVVDVPELQFLALDGRIEAGVKPGESASFDDAIAAMYSVAYGLKFMSKLREENPFDFSVMPLEGLWSSESGEFEFAKVEPWLYTLLILQPDHITQDMVERTVEGAKAKGPNPSLPLLRLQRWREGRSIQIMHLGPYADEPRTIEKMTAFAREHGYRLEGRHHEVYLGDPRRARPANLKTILRHPIT